MEFEIPFGGKKRKSLFVDKVGSKIDGTATYSAYFYDDISYPSEYLKELRAFDTAKPEDKVNIYIGSNGGMLDTTISLIEHIRNCKAETVAYVSFAASAATLIALACDKVSMYPHSYFMVHNFSAGGQGKGAELKARADFEDKWSKEIFEDLYTGFLTPKEIEAVREDRDLWILQKECIERLTKLGKYSDAKHSLRV